MNNLFFYQKKLTKNIKTVIAFSKIAATFATPKTNTHT
jgi:hypothetical protein